MSGPRHPASLRQIEAADPRACTWVSANAGSGKTRVLTDRVARLLLGGSPPENILCLTYTRAAASEMQNRLFRRLGDWAMLDDAPLAAALAALGVEGTADTATLNAARRLFARAIETPGGLRIQTIHSFCASLLRRYPLEAGLSPGFAEMDDAAADRLRAEVLDAVAAEAPEDFAAMAQLVADTDLTGLADDVVRFRRGFPDRPDRARVLRALDLPEGLTAGGVPAALTDGLDRAEAGRLAAAMSCQTATLAAVAEALATLLAEGPGEGRFETLAQRLLTKEGAPRKNVLPEKRRLELGPVLATTFDALVDRVLHVRALEAGLAAAERTMALHGFAARFLRAWEAGMAARGLLGFDDLIDRTEALLGTSGVADWVLWRLDGALDHILVDEAQDTSPLQWRTIGHLTREMTSGAGSLRAETKTLFVVGDLKQSIYSFQGADPDGFVRMRDGFARSLGAAGRNLARLELDHSFRSSPAILGVVDATFGPGNRTGLGDAVHHVAFHEDMPGRVDLWPVVERAGMAEKGHWTDPVDMVVEEHHNLVLADRIADEIRRIIGSEVLWARGPGGAFHPRAITEGDFLILVQRRSPLFHAIIAACKRKGLRVAGADVLRLGEDLAVKDLLAALAFVATPEDDLSLAALLRSPLFGWGEGALHDLAAGRPEGAYLWQALRAQADRYPETLARLDAWRREADFLRPYEMLERILLRDGGRVRLIGRLGDEAADGLDALLAQALAWEQAGVPGLTAFLARMQAAELDVKRRAEDRGDKIRVMTVHGAKGLESPIVILPDTGPNRSRGRIDDRILAGPDGVPLWRGPSAEMPPTIAALSRALQDGRKAEGQRLLYVAMTRAEQWLIAAAAGDLGKDGTCWHDQIAAGLAARGAGAQDFGFGTGLRLAADWPEGITAAAPMPAVPMATTPPPWALAAAPKPPRPLPPRAPSDLGGAKALPGEAGLDEAAAMWRGIRLHLLLQHLPGVPPAERAAQAARLLGAEPDLSVLLAEAAAVLDAPDLAPVFAPGALTEVEITAPVGALGGTRILGAIDRLVIAPDEILAVDFKSNAAVPPSPEAVPEGLLRQMGAYAAALAQVYPGRQIATALLWTRTARLMRLPGPLVEAALLRAAHEAVTEISSA